MFRKNKQIEIQSAKPTTKTSYIPEIVVKLTPTTQDKMQVLDEFYLWLFENNFDANNACVLIKYKQHLKSKERV